MKRLLFNLLSALSLLLLILTLIFWIRSYPLGDNLTAHHPPLRLEVASIDGLLRIGFGTWRATNPQFEHRKGWNATFWPAQRGFSEKLSADLRIGTKLGFKYEPWQWFTPGIAANMHIITIPHWLPAICFLLLPLLRTRAWLSERRLSRIARCPHCGYDMRATPALCPECGATPPAAL